MFLIFFIIATMLNTGMCYLIWQKYNIEAKKIAVISGFIGGFLDTGIFMLDKSNIHAIELCILSAFLIILSYIDIKLSKIPNKICIFIFALGIINMFLMNASIMKSLLTFIIIFFLMSFIYSFFGGRAIGGGDVKLISAASIILGFWPSFYMIFISFLYAIIFHIIIYKRDFRKKAIKLGPYISLGIITLCIYMLI